MQEYQVLDPDWDDQTYVTDGDNVEYVVYFD